jgi:hypothetical protein
MSPASLRDLAAGLERATAGTVALSKAMFLALGGELRQEPVSNQGGAMVTLPYWRGEKYPCCGISFTTNLAHIVGNLRQRGLWFRVNARCDRGELQDTFEAGVEDVTMACTYGHGSGATPELALCAALLRHMAAVAAVADTEVA